MRRVVFIDTSVTGYEAVLTRGSSDVLVVLLDSAEDAIKKIAATLTAFTALECIEIFSHGAAGHLFLPGTSLSLATIGQYESELKTIGAALSADGDILLHGCAIADGEDGRSLLEALAELTGADIAASADDTGPTILGGDSVLEVSTGPVVQSVLDTQAYSSLLVDDFANNTSTSGSVTVGGTKAGSIQFSGDEDWFRVTLSAGVTYTLEARGSATSNGTLSDPYLVLYDSFGFFLAGDDDTGTGLNSLISFTPLGGTYYLGVSDSFLSATGTYQVRVTAADDYAANTTTSGLISIGNFSSGTINFGGDDDWFRINVVGGAQYLVEILGSPSSNGTLADPYLEIYDGSGFFLGSDDDSGTGFDAAAIFAPGGSGNYYISAGSASPSGTGTYKILVTQLSTDDYSATSSTTGQLLIGGASSGVIETAGDEDWFAMSLDAGVTYTFEVLGADSANGSLVDPYLEIYDIDGGSLLSSDDDSGFGLNASETVAYTPVSGIFYLSASSSPFAPGGTGSYTVTATVYDDVLAFTNTMKTLSVGGTNSGNIERWPDEDWFRVTLTGGVQYNLEVLGIDSSDGTLPDPFLWLYDNAGNLLTGSDSGGTGRNASLLFTPAGGTYYLAAASQNSSGTGTYTVRLSVASNLITGGATADTLDGTSGPDTLVGLDGNDTLRGLEAIDTLQGGNGNDLLLGGPGDDRIDGGAGVDTATYSTGTSGVFVSLAIATAQATGGAGTDTLVSIENLTGSSFADTLIGNAGNNVLDGAAGTDRMEGGAGADTYHVRQAADVVVEVAGGGVDIVLSYLTHTTSQTYNLGTAIENGRIATAAASNMTGNGLNNLINAGAGNNILVGGTGADTLSYAFGLTPTSTTGVTVSLAVTTAQATGGSGTDTVSGFEHLTGSGKGDILTGNAGNNILNGGLGNDTLLGLEGADTLIGGGGKDVLNGGAGNDVFDFNALSEMSPLSSSRDVIEGFVRGEDKIDLSTLDANTATAVNDAFNGVLIASSATFTTAGQLRLTAGVLFGNTDADAEAEFSIALTGITALNSADLVL